jgi:hypothetical protein
MTDVEIKGAHGANDDQYQTQEKQLCFMIDHTLTLITKRPAVRFNRSLSAFSESNLNWCVEILPTAMPQMQRRKRASGAA